MSDWTFVTAHGDDHGDLSLGELFETCTRVHSSLSSLPRHVDTAQRILHACERLINSCVHRIDTAGIVSRNEELDDVATESIRYAPFWDGRSSQYPSHARFGRSKAAVSLHVGGASR